MLRGALKENERLSGNFMGDIIYGKRPIIEAFRSGTTVKKVYIFENMKGKDEFLMEIKDLSYNKILSLKEVSKKELQIISKTQKHGGVVAEVKEKQYVRIEDILSFAKEKNEEPLLLILNRIEDPQNLGAVLRSAEGAGVHGIILPKRRSAKVNPTVVKTSAGAVYHLLISLVSNISQAVSKLKDNGIWIIGSDSSADKMYYEVDFRLPTAIIIGSEGRGIQNLIKKKCDFIVKIPMLGKIQSLNASASAGILVYEALKQRLEVK